MAYSLFHNSQPFLRVHIHKKALRNFEKSLFSRIKKLSSHYLLKSSKGIPNNFVDKKMYIAIFFFLLLWFTIIRS